MPAVLNRYVDPITLSEVEAGVARQSSQALTDFVRGDEQPLMLRLQDMQTGREIEAPIPALALRLLAEALARMGEGQSVSVMPMDAHLSTQQASELLGVSRPYFVKLLKEGRIPYQKVGAQRRVCLEALRAYMAACGEEAARAIKQMSADAQRLGLYE